MSTLNYKTCTKCKQSLPATLEFFYAHPRYKYGVQSWCKQCHKAVISQNGKDYRKTDRYKENLKRWPSTSNKEYMRAKNKRQYDRHRDSELQRLRKNRLRFADRRREYDKIYKKSHPEQAKAHRAKRRALKLMAPGTYNEADIKRIYDEQDGRCLYCGIRVFDDYQIDHVIPLTRGGSNWPDNLAVACVSCNCSKCDKLIPEWEKVRGW